MNNINLKQFYKVKKPTILNHLLFPEAPPLEENIRKTKSNERALFKKVKYVILKDHAFKRWNERVGPKSSFDVVQKIFETIILHCPYRLSKTSDNHCLIDNDILFIYEIINQDTVVIISIYGRVSLTPALANIQGIRHFIHKQGDKVGLAPSEDELEKQTLPPFPYQILEYKGSTVSYYLEIYKTTENRPPFIILTTNSISKDSNFVGQPERMLISTPSQKALSNTTLTVLFNLGYRKYVMQQLKIFHKEKWINAESEIGSSKIAAFFKDCVPTELVMIEKGENDE